MDSVTLTKNNERTSRPACRRCGSDGNEGYYWATSSVTGHNVMIERTLETIPADKGAIVPTHSIHACFRKDAGLDSVPSFPDAVPSVPADEPEVDYRHPGQECPCDECTAEPEDDEDKRIRADIEAAKIPTAPAYVRGDNPLADAIRDIVGPVQIDHAEVDRLIDAKLKGHLFPTQTVVIRNGESKTVPGLSHERLARVMAALGAGVNVLMVGPAGTGKSHIAGQCAEAMDVPFESMSLTSQTGEAKFTGFVDAAGNYHSTEIYDWAKSVDGGLLCLDELDNGNPNILGWMNAVISNREVRFPNGEKIKITPNHFLTGTANTYGFGRTREYVGRNPIDAATKNRFAVITIAIDDALETALVHGTGVKSATADKILGYVRKLRTNADAKGVNLVMSPRNSVGMAKLLTSDVYDWDMALEDQVQCGIDEITWAKIAA